MRRNPLIVLLLATCCNGVELKDDLLSFVNGDQLHGHLAGIAADSSLLWSRDDVSGEVKFKSSDIRRVVLRGGDPLKSLGKLSHIGTMNGDRIPGNIRELDDKRVVIETEFGGMLEFPRNQVGLLAPSPLGGRLLYHGSFDPNEWSMIDIEHPDGIPAPVEDVKKKDAIPQWKHSGSSWYWKNEKTGTALARKSGLPDRAILQFEIAWKKRLSLAIGFHANFKNPEVAEKGDKKRVAAVNVAKSVSLPKIFGESYALHLYSNYVMLYRASFDDTGRPLLDRVQATNSNLRLGDAGKASVEIRCNRLSGEIILFVDGEFVAQWSELDGALGDADGYAGKGNGFGFVAQTENSSVRISDIVVAEWNGMPDSARSMQVDDADIVLLANGTDRFSGKITGLHDGLLKLEGRFGDFEFPIAEIAEVRFAKSGLAKVEENSSDEVRIRFHPLGRISGLPLEGDGRTLRMRNPSAGEIDVGLDSAVMLEFRETGSFLDDWNDEF